MLKGVFNDSGGKHIGALSRHAIQRDVSFNLKATHTTDSWLGRHLGKEREGGGGRAYVMRAGPGRDVTGPETGWEGREAGDDQDQKGASGDG